MGNLTKETIREKGYKLGLDLIGFANIERFKDAPLNMNPKSIFPETKKQLLL
jgi:hypothetical protein